MVSEYNKTIGELLEIANKFGLFSIRFFDESEFQKFFLNFGSHVKSYDEICLSGYFSEGGSKLIREASKGSNVKIRILTCQFREENGKLSPRDTLTLEAIRLLNQEPNIEVRIHPLIHCRMFIGLRENYNTLVLGSFDFNKEGGGQERRDAGIETHNSDLVNEALRYFNGVWTEERYSKSLDQRYPEDKYF